MQRERKRERETQRACMAKMEKYYLGILEANREAYKIPETKLRQRIYNLMANGLRHPSGPVQTSARYIYRQSSVIIF